MTIKSNNKIKGHLALVVANTCFGLMAPFSKIAMLSGLIGPILVTQSRTFGGMILLQTSDATDSGPAWLRTLVRGQHAAGGTKALQCLRSCKSMIITDSTENNHQTL